nr:MAG: hypothetical protein [XiangYun hepe-virga-like virus 5]
MGSLILILSLIIVGVGAQFYSIARGGFAWREAPMVSYNCAGKRVVECSDSLFDLAKALQPLIRFIDGYITPSEARYIGIESQYCHPEVSEIRSFVHGHTNDVCVAYSNTKVVLPGCGDYNYSPVHKGWLSRGRLLQKPFEVGRLGSYHCIAGSYYYAGTQFVDQLHYQVAMSTQKSLMLEWRESGIAEFVFKDSVELPSVYGRHFEVCLDPGDERLATNVTRIGDVFIRVNNCKQYLAYNSTYSMCADHFVRPVCNHLLYKRHLRGVVRLYVPRFVTSIADPISGMTCGHFNVTDGELVKVLSTAVDYLINDNTTSMILGAVREALASMRTSDPIVGATVYQHVVNVTDRVVAATITQLGVILKHAVRNTSSEFHALNLAIESLTHALSASVVGMPWHVLFNESTTFSRGQLNLTREYALQDISFWNSTLYDFYDRVEKAFKPKIESPKQVGGVFDWLATALRSLLQPFVDLLQVMLKALFNDALSSLEFLLDPVLNLLLQLATRAADYLTKLVEAFEQPLLSMVEALSKLITALLKVFVDVVKAVDVRLRLVEYTVIMLVLLRTLVNNTLAIALLLAIITTYYPLSRQQGETSPLLLIGYFSD